MALFGGIRRPTIYLQKNVPFILLVKSLKITKSNAILCIKLIKREITPVLLLSNGAWVF